MSECAEVARQIEILSLLVGLILCTLIATVLTHFIFRDRDEWVLRHKEAPDA